ncbi:MAG: alpha/beta hydrolase fold domain-containing protein [Planctomycetota bacterium]
MPFTRFTPLFLLVLPLATAQAQPVNQPQLPETALYSKTPQADLNLYFYYPQGHSPDANAPAVLFFFGGGWFNGTPNHFRSQAQHLAARGIVAVTADYRTKRRHGTTPFDCLADAITAMRYLRQHADALGLDPNRIGAGGGSAGGHLAIALSTTTAPDLIPNQPEALANTPFHPDALLLFNPVYDNGPTGYAHNRIGDRYTDFSPAHNLHAGMPPTLVLLGDQDDLIPVATAEKVRDTMTKLGVRSDLIVYPNQKHGFFNRRENDNTMYQATLQAMDTFLVSLGWLKPPRPPRL